LSYIQFWNYSKLPERGVEEIHIHCDDNIIYKGCLRKAYSTLILFTSDVKITKTIDLGLLTDIRRKNKYQILDETNSVSKKVIYNVSIFIFQFVNFLFLLGLLCDAVGPISK
jgi:hypothetical protein